MRKVDIERAEVLRYLGYKNQELNQSLSTVVEECLSEVQSLIEPRWVFQTHPILTVDSGIQLTGTNMILPGQDIARHLGQADAAVLMAVTLGIRVEQQILYYEKMELTRAVILDACASAAVEAVADQFCQKLADQMKSNNQYLTTRFSPGYGDLPLNLQRKLINVLHAERRIGLGATTQSILVPGKSITAIAGVLTKKQSNAQRQCAECNLYSTCEFKKDGDGYGC